MCSSLQKQLFIKKTTNTAGSSELRGSKSKVNFQKEVTNLLYKAATLNLASDVVSCNPVVPVDCISTLADWKDVRAKSYNTKGLCTEYFW